MHRRSLGENWNVAMSLKRAHTISCEYAPTTPSGRTGSDSFRSGASVPEDDAVDLDRRSGLDLGTVTCSADAPLEKSA